MPTKSKTPRVSFRLYRGSQLYLVSGYLVKTPDGSLWAFPEDQAHEANPSLAGAYRLDPSQLEEQPDTDDGRKIYLYREVLNAPQEEPQTPPSVLGHYQEF